MKTFLLAVICVLTVFPKYGNNQDINFTAWEIIEIPVDIGSQSVGYGEDLFYVTNPYTQQITVYNKQGEIVNRFGREGQGPGEFGKHSPGAILVLDEGILTNDLTNFRIQLLDHKGSHIRSFTLMRDIPVTAVIKMFEGEDDGILMYGTGVDVNMDTGVMSMSYSVMDYNLVTGEYLILYEKFTEPANLMEINPISGYPLPVIQNGVIYQPANDRYRIDMCSYQGDSKGAIELDGKSRRITRKIQDHLLQSDELQQALEMSMGLVNFTFPSHLPFIRSIMFLNEYLLVWSWEDWYEKTFSGGEFRMDVFDRDGNYLGKGKVDFDPDKVVYMKDDLVVTLETVDDEGLIRMRKYK